VFIKLIFGTGFNYPGHRNRKDPNFRLVDKYSRFDGANGKHRSHNHYESSMMSSDLETTTFLDSEDDASSRITATTGRKEFSIRIIIISSVRLILLISNVHK